jgi:serine/threonine protein kinase
MYAYVLSMLNLKCSIDLYPANILFRMKHRGQQRRSAYKNQRTSALERIDGLEDAHSPRYLVDHSVYRDSDSVRFDEWENLDISELEVKIGDFGVCKFMARLNFGST